MSNKGEKIMNKKMYIFLTVLWGLPMSLIGTLAMIVLIISGHKLRKEPYSIVFEIGKGWGAVTIGYVVIRQESLSDAVRSHERGHCIQNAMFGPLMPLTVGIPSLIRCIYRDIKYHRKGIKPQTEYDAIWFEKQATILGKY